MKQLANSTFDCSREEFSRLPGMIEKCMPILERHLGKEYVSKNVVDAQGIIIDFFSNTHAKAPSLKETKKEIEKISSLAKELYSSLKDVSSPIEDEFWRIYYQYQFAGKPEYKNAWMSEIQHSLLHFRVILNMVQEKIPKSRRWPESINPEKEVIRGLARLYQNSTGKEPKAGSCRRNDLYQGAFFNLVEDVLLTLEVEKHVTGEDEEDINLALGKAIERALR